MQSTCPRSFLPPLQVGLSVTLEHKYGHRDLVDMINKLGFCSSYTEANKYRSNASVVQGVDLPEQVAGSFLQYQADNVDHAYRTLDGHGSIHVMGQMATFTPGIQENPMAQGGGHGGSPATSKSESGGTERSKYTLIKNPRSKIYSQKIRPPGPQTVE